MSDRQDDETKLRSLRAVWLSLPDEDPPERGLAQLMAAARVKADEMAKPSAWRRVLDLLRRPSMLAFATIILLLGGVVIIGQHREQVETAPVISAPTAGSVEPEAARAEPSAVAPATDSPPSPMVAGAPNREVAPTAVAPVRRTPAKRPVEHSVKEQEKVQREDALAVKVESKPPRKPDVPTTKPAGLASDMDEKPSSVDPTASQFARANVVPPLSQLLAQCRSAATRGDCVAVRTIAQRIAKQDATFFRDHVSKDAMLNKCLTADAPAAE